MTGLLIIVVAIVGFASSNVIAAAEEDEKTKQDLDKLEGSWNCFSGESSGKPIPEATVKQLKLVLTKEKYTTTRGDEVLFEGTYKIDAAKTPKTIDVTALQGEKKGQVANGIYWLDGGTLKLCYPAIPGKDRPKVFASKPGSGLQLVIWKRSKS